MPGIPPRVVHADEKRPAVGVHERAEGFGDGVPHPLVHAALAQVEFFLKLHGIGLTAVNECFLFGGRALARPRDGQTFAPPPSAIIFINSELLEPKT